MEVNISHRSRQEILNTSDLARPDLFKNALNELIQLMKVVGYLWNLFKVNGFFSNYEHISFFFA